MNTPKMMAKTLKYRNEFDMLHVELVDIVYIIEFRLIERFPEFRLVIARDVEMEEDAFAEPLKNRITVRQSVYIAACEGDAGARIILAHELGHFLLHRDKDAPMHMDPRGAIQPIRRMTATESTEDQADMFARHFLAPPHLAYQYRDQPLDLAKATGVPVSICIGNITMSKWPEVYALRNKQDPNEELPATSDRSFHSPCDAGIQRCSSPLTDDR
jgi:hypothetical protein